MDFLIDSPTREPLPLQVTGLILSGGKSKRMGRPKAFLPFEGSTVIGHIVHEIRDLFNEIFIVANEVESFEDLGVDVVKDILPHRGPLGGILSGLMTSSNHYAFVMACDMPLIDKRLVRELVSRRQDNDVVVLSHPQGIEPLFGVYSKNCIKPLEESLFAGNLSVQDFLSGLKAGIYEWMPERPDADALPPFFNINTPQDYSRVIARAGMGVSILPERRP
ncbi:MAG: molybdenum cofactor guanylyltransferase [Candidatus Melainabacteria bacterium]|nr:MAG: molybdenum cofactor guanylyltransferase [Candidatus Melainabacteria bacterium]